MPIIAGVLLLVSVALWRGELRAWLGRLLAAGQFWLLQHALRTTYITVQPQQIGQVITVNEHLIYIRHASGRAAFLPSAPPAPVRPPMPRRLRAVLATFFTL